MEVKLYVKNGCPGCERAVSLLNGFHISFEKFVIDEDVTLGEVKDMFPEARAVPIIIINDILIEGVSELRTILEYNQQELLRKH